MYAAGDYDLAGFCVGAVDRDKVLTGANISPGDLIFGLASSGLHSNGFSLVRRIIEQQGWKLDESLPGQGGRALGEILLEPTRIYVRMLLPLIQKGWIKGLAHITGGGLLENIPRALPDDCRAEIDADRLELPTIFSMLQSGGRITPEEMCRTFNCGVGMAVIIDREGALATTELIADREEPELIGEIVEGPRGCTVRGSAGTWNSPKGWSATHNA